MLSLETQESKPSWNLCTGSHGPATWLRETTQKLRLSQRQTRPSVKLKFRFYATTCIRIERVGGGGLQLVILEICLGTEVRTTDSHTTVMRLIKSHTRTEESGVASKHTAMWKFNKHKLIKSLQSPKHNNASTMDCFVIRFKCIIYTSGSSL